MNSHKDKLLKKAIKKPTASLNLRHTKKKKRDLL